MGDGHHHDHHPASDPHSHRHAKGFAETLRGLIAPHSHDSSDSIDSDLEDSELGTRAVLVSMVLLVATAAIQAAVVALSGSVALLSDTLHNGADALTAVPLWIAFRLANRPPTRRFTYGLGKVEDLAGLVVVLVIAFSAGVAIYEAFERLLHPEKLTHLPLVVIAGLIGVAGNEVVAQYRLRVGRRIGSAALEADGEHARADGIASLLVVVGAIAVACGLPWADPVIGLLIAVVILLILARTARSVGQRLLDAVNPAVIDRIETTVKSVSGVSAVTEVRARWMGHRLLAQVRLSVRGSLSMSDAHAIAERVLHQLLHDVPKLSDAIVHVDPSEEHSEAHHVTAHHRA
jgi:cation diffusion facilitator family transporter